MKIPVNKISPNPQQPRTVFDEEYIKGLAASIKEHGLENPITVEQNENGFYTLVDGECRWRAHKLAKIRYIEAVVRPATNHSGKERLISAMVANVTRDNMNKVDEANGYKKMQGFGMSVRQISIVVGKPESRIRSLLPILDLEPEIQKLVAAERLPHQKEAIDALMTIPAGEERIEFSKMMANRRATVKMIVKNCIRYNEAVHPAKGKMKKMRVPALEVSGLTQEPMEWNALFQINRVPPWQRFTEAVMDTCDNCSLRDVASETTCRNCPLVDMCRRMLEKTQLC